MEDKKSFLMFYDWEPLLLMLERKDVGDLIIALYAFEIRGEIPKDDELSPSAWGLFTYLSGLIEENKKKWLQKQVSGSLGGKKSAEARSKNQAEVEQDSSTSQAGVKHDSSTDQADAEQIQPKDKVKDKDKVKVKDKEETEKESVSNETPKKRDFSLRDVADIVNSFPLFQGKEEVIEIVRAYCQMRTKKKSAIATSGTLERFLKRVVALSDDGFGNPNLQNAILIIQQSVDNSWKDAYPLKKEEQPKDDWRNIDFMAEAERLKKEGKL